MSDVKWIKITTDIFDNRKMKQIENMPDGDTILVIWLKLLTLAGNVNEDGYIYLTKDVPYNDQLLATQFNRPLATIQLALSVFEKFNMIEIVDDIIKVSNWEKYQNIEGMEKIREQNRIRKQRQREREKLLLMDNNVTSHVTVTQSHATDKEEDIDKEKKEILKKESDDIPDFDLEEAWKKIRELYPKTRKNGMDMAKLRFLDLFKGISPNQYKDLAKMIARAVDLYKKDCIEQGDESFKYCPNMDKWLTESAGYWIEQAEEYERNRNAKTESEQ